MLPVWGGQRRLLLISSQLRRFAPAAPAFQLPRWTWLATCSHAARAPIGELAHLLTWRPSSPWESGESDQPSHTQYGLSTTSRATNIIAVGPRSEATGLSQFPTWTSMPERTLDFESPREGANKSSIEIMFAFHLEP